MPLVPLPKPVLAPETTAVVVVDMQYFDAHREHGLALRAAPGELDEYFEQVDEIVPRIRALQECAREARAALVHVRLCSHQPGGADRSRTHRLRDWRYEAGTREAEFLDELAPAPGETVVDKTTSGAFNSGRLESVLRERGIETVVICGVDTRFCVETTVRDASDRGFEVVLVGDACASKSRELHEQGVTLLRDAYCVVLQTDEVIATLGDDRRIPSDGAPAAR